jgi:hypothetical protein
MGLSKVFPCLKSKEEKGKQKQRDKLKLKDKNEKEKQGASGANTSSTPDKPPVIPPINPVSSEDNGTEAPKEEPPDEDEDEDEDPTRSISRRVWNRAYDELADGDDTKKLVEAYAKIIKKARNPDPNPSASDDEDIEDMKDPIQRDKVMREALKSGQERVYKSTALSNAVGRVSSFVLKFKDVIDFAVGNIPQAALPWAGVSIGLSVS